MVWLSSDKVEVQADVFRELGSGVETDNHVAYCVARARRGVVVLFVYQRHLWTAAVVSAEVVPCPLQRPPSPIATTNRLRPLGSGKACRGAIYSGTRSDSWVRPM